MTGAFTITKYLLLTLLGTKCLGSTDCRVENIAPKEAPPMRFVPGLGRVKGQILRPQLSQYEAPVSVEQFLGIPFAKVPHRFAPPEMADPWQPETLDATEAKASCPQVKSTTEEAESWMLPKSAEISEDCLSLNIWVPGEATSNRELLPVMVWIYGGSFQAGSASLPLYSGLWLAAFGDVVVVTINYRLGALGFAHLPNGLIPGNLGLLDQQAALVWIRHHIGSFRGDANAVTIFGESAGGGSVMAHLAAPGSHGLFHGMIAQSGGILDPWATRTPEFLTNVTLELAKLLGCPEEAVNDRDYEWIRAFLANAPLTNIVEVSTKHEMFIPVDTDELFFKGSMSARFHSQDNSKVAIMIGFTENEYTIFMHLADPTRFPPNAPWTLDRNGYAELAEKLLNAEHLGLKPAFLKSVLWHYDTVPDKSLPGEYVNRLDRLVSDGLMVCKEIEAAKILLGDRLKQNSNVENSGVYLYLFNETVKYPTESDRNTFGAPHGAELKYHFGQPLKDEICSSMKDGSRPAKCHVDLSKMMMRYWSNFAKYGTPNAKVTTTNNKLPIWPATTSNDHIQFRVLQACKDLPDTAANLRESDCEFWEEIVSANAKVLESGHNAATLDNLPMPIALLTIILPPLLASLHQILY